MKLSEYIKALQELQDQHSGLDIEVMVPYPSTRTNGGVYVVPASVPKIWPVEKEEENLWFVRQDASPIKPGTQAKNSGPDGVLVVLDKK